jgi:16S rRNA processing protein RimM
MSDREKSAREDALVAIGKVVRAHGIRGMIAVSLLTDFPERFRKLDRVALERDGRLLGWYAITHVEILSEIVRVKLDGVNDRDAAQLLKGSYFSVPQSDTVGLDENSAYEYDLLGCEVIDTDGSRIGTVARIERYPANDILIVETDTESLMVPAIRNIIREVDIDNRRIVAAIPEGLPTLPLDAR